MPLRTARRSRALRGHILRLWIHDVTLSVFVVMSKPRHAEGQAIFVPTFRCQVEEVVGANQEAEPAPVSGISIEDFPAGILVKDARSRALLGAKSNRAVLLLHLTLL